MRRRRLIAGLGAVATAPLVARCGAPAARRVPRVGYLSGNMATTTAHAAFVRKLSSLGYVDPQNVEIISRGPSTEATELRQLADELVSLRVDVIVAAGGSAQLAAAAATKTIPIVLVVGPDPEVIGLVESIARPGGNITGVAIDFISEGPKKVQLLREVVPTARHVLALYRSDNTSIDSARSAQIAGARIGVDVETMGLKAPSELDMIFDALKTSRFDGITATSIVSAVTGEVERLPLVADGLRIPQIFGDMEFIDAGGLMHYGADFDTVQERGAVFVDRILRGAAPAELPVEFATRSELVINLVAARQIGLTIPADVLRQATRVIS